MSTPIVKDSHAINSFRDSDFDAYSAYGEVIDNSIQAGATFCKIHFDCFYENRRGPQYSKINFVAFGDDGEGMDKEIIMNCLQLGYSSRYNDRKGIGRFGVGMTLGAIHECKKVEVYSKKSDGKWLYVYFDIDEMMTDKSDGISKPVAKNPPDELTHLISPEKGTLVIWSKYDRQRGSADKIINESHLWMGRTFRYFIWDGFEIQINKDNVYAVDPLYLNLDKTKFPNDHKGEYRGEDIIEVEIPKEHQVEDGPKSSKVIIRYSLLPKHYMRHGSGNSGNHPESIERHFDRNTGVSILRKKREVKDPDHPIARFLSVDLVTQINRFWGCEILFEPELDFFFSVKNIKRGADPRQPLRDKLKKPIGNVAGTCLEDIRAYWKTVKKEKEAELEEKYKETGQSTKHSEATQIAEKTPAVTQREKKSEEEVIKDIKKTHEDVGKERLEQLAKLVLSNRITVLEGEWDSPNFVQVKHYGGGSSLTYNTGHEFFKRYTDLLNELENSDEELEKSVLTMIDLILISYSMSEAEFNSKEQYSVEDFLEDFKLRWGNNLKRLFKNWTIDG